MYTLHKSKWIVVGTVAGGSLAVYVAGSESDVVQGRCVASSVSLPAGTGSCPAV